MIGRDRPRNRSVDCEIPANDPGSGLQYRPIPLLFLQYPPPQQESLIRMELISRPKNDRYTRPGHYRELEAQLRKNSAHAEIPCLVAYAFDMRTRIGPFLYADMRLLTAGPRAIAGALSAAGFTQTRIVQTQWNPNFRPSEARFGNRPPQMLFVSSMQIHSAKAYELIADAHKLGDQRPFIVAGGAKAIYEAWDFFGFEYEGKQYSADVACTGEEFVLLELLDRIM